MQDLRVIGVENGALLVVSDDGVRYRIPIDEVLHSRIRQSAPEPGSGRKVSPREIQSHIRAGMSAADVAAVTGASLEYIQKFEGPVLAEREFVVETALAVPVITADDADPFTQGITFGAAITNRLLSLSASNVRWASWKEEVAGWVVKLAFTASDVDHDARWSFDPRKQALAPLNNEARTLSQQGELPGAMIPRLRAVSSNSGDKAPDASRFDSGAFDVSAFGAAVGHGSGNAPSSGASRVHSLDDFDRDAAADTATQQSSRFGAGAADRESNQTADLLEALRRRRGEREAASFGDEIDDEQESSHARSTGSGIRLVDVPLDSYLADEERHMSAHEPTRAQPEGPAVPRTQATKSREVKPNETKPQDTKPQPRTQSTAPQPQVAAKSRKGRVSMPSWDDIVFGARPDDDPA